MKRTALALAAALGLVLGTALTADANTHAPCSYHYATPPSVQLIDGGVATLAGSGAIGGCPAPIGTESVSLTVAVQHLEAGTWITKGTAVSPPKGWSRITRGARQTSATATAACLPGDWRTETTENAGGSDGVPEWHSTTVTFTPGDSGVCGSYGGGD